MKTFRLVLPFFCIFTALLSFAQKPNLYVVISDENLPLYKRIISGISIDSQADFVEFVLEGNTVHTADLMKQVLTLKPLVIITIGPKSSNAAKKITEKIPIIYCLVPRPENYDLAQNNIVGIRLEVPFQKQLETLRSLLPKTKNVGVVFNPSQSKLIANQAQAALQKEGLVFVPVEALKPSDVKKSLEKLKNEVDALWMISDPISLNIKSWNASNEYCLAHKIPFFALDDGFVARGALLSFSIDYVWTGRQAARLANKIFLDRYPVKSISLVDQEGLGLSVNMSTATKLNIEKELSLNILNFAAQNNYTVQAFH